MTGRGRADARPPPYLIVISIVIESFVADRSGPHAARLNANVALPTSGIEVSFPQTGKSAELRRLRTSAAGLWTVVGRGLT
jgi:hypothetical protein